MNVIVNCKSCHKPTEKVIENGIVVVRVCVNPECPRTSEALLAGVRHPEVRCAQCGGFTLIRDGHILSDKHLWCYSVGGLGCGAEVHIPDSYRSLFLERMLMDLRKAMDPPQHLATAD